MNSRVLLGYGILSMALLTIGSFMPFTSLIHHLFMIDTIVHFFLCCAVALISMILFRQRKTAFLLAFAVTPYGFMLEHLHTWLTGEPFAAVNALANNAGVLVGIAAGFVLRLKNHNNRVQQRDEAPDPGTE
ncbi:MAG: hypothetical protein HGA56_06755 [Chlorobiaceae bacterium]|nr:hypothetical protein [Chlorobiaceae bacterium]